MGRPPLGVHPVNVRLTDELIRRVDALVGRSRSRFIREAIEERLKREERKQARLQRDYRSCGTVACSAVPIYWPRLP